MVEGFEEYTHDPLSKEENVAKNRIVKYLQKCVGKKKARSNRNIQYNLSLEGINVKPARVRKIIHEIRMKNEVPNLLANSYGYYICNDTDEVKQYARSLFQRTRSIEEIALNLLATNGIPEEDLFDEKY